MGLAGTKQHSIWNDTGTTASYLQRADKLRKEQQLRLAGIGVCKDLLVDITLIKTACKRRISHNKRIARLVVILF